MWVGKKKNYDLVTLKNMFIFHLLFNVITNK